MTDSTYAVREMATDCLAGALMALTFRLILADPLIGIAAGIAIAAALLWPQRGLLKRRLPFLVQVGRAVQAYSVRAAQVAWSDVRETASTVAGTVQVFRTKHGLRLPKRHSRAFRYAP